MHRTVLSLLIVSAIVVAAVLGFNMLRAGTSVPVAKADAVAERPASTECGPGWVAAWNASPLAAPGAATPARPTVSGRSLRMIVRPTAAGSQIRLLLSNRYGTEPLRLTEVSAALSGTGAALAGAVVPVTFAGKAVAQIPAREVLVSDPVALTVAPAAELAISMFVPGRPAVVSEHPLAMQTSYMSGSDDFGAAAGSPDGSGFDRSINSWLILTGVDVRVPRSTNAVMLMGDSITDGVGSSPDADRRWSDDLAARLATLGGGSEMTVLNAGIAGNQLLANRPREVGESALSRLDWEVVGRPGVTDVILHAGTNDLAAGASAQSVIAGMTRFADLAHKAGLRVFLTTITPSNAGSHGSKSTVAARDEVNRWVRSQGRSYADGVFDFATAVADRSQPNRLVSAFDAGDGLHLSDSGYQALAGAVDLGALSGSRCLS